MKRNEICVFLFSVFLQDQRILIYIHFTILSDFRKRSKKRFKGVCHKMISEIGRMTTVGRAFTAQLLRVRFQAVRKGTVPVALSKRTEIIFFDRTAVFLMKFSVYLPSGFFRFSESDIGLSLLQRGAVQENPAKSCEEIQSYLPPFPWLDHSITEISAFSNSSSAKIVCTSRFIARTASVFSIP